jgi:glycosyltransferase involved in cell wall biosynthesis
MLGPISWRTPPRHYGPWERVVTTITEGLVKRGIEVTLFATGDSHTGGKLAWVCPRPYSEDPSLDAKVWECLHIAHCFEHADEFDLIHNNFDFLPLTYSRLVETPVVTTIHGFSSPRILPVYKRYDDRVHYVSISNADRSPELNYIATVHHGIPIEEFPFHDGARSYLLFFGRIHHDKGVYEAIQAAKKVGAKLVIAGVIQDEEYYKTRVEPYLDENIEYIGSVGPDRRAEVLGNATALLHLINFEEPFGLSLVEAMACGTPVIACGRGSIPEIITHGETGFIVKDTGEAAEAVGRIDEIDRRACRRTVEERFTSDRMVEKYINIYKQILAIHQNEN